MSIYSEEFFGNLHGASWVCTHSVANIKTNDCRNGQQISYPVLPDKSHSTIPVERMWLCAAAQLQNSTYRSLNQHSGWLSLKIGTKSSGEDPSQNPRGRTNNTHRGVNIFLRCCRWKTILLQANRWPRWNWKTNPTTKRAISEKGSRMGSKPGTILNEANIKEFTKIDGNTTSYSINGIKASARIRVEQDADLVLKSLKFKMLGQPFDDVLLATDRQNKHYKANVDRIFLKDGLLFQKYYGETGSVKYYQILIPMQLVNEVLRNLNGEFGKHPGITKMMIAYRRKYHYPNMAQLIREWVMSCEQCLRESRNNPRLTRPPLQNTNEYITAPKDAMQVDLVPGLPPSGGYENIVRAMDVFSRYLFAYPTSNQDAKTVAKVIINIMTKRAYLPRTLLSDKGTAYFTSYVNKEVAGVRGITLKHATTKYAQIIGLLERSHASTKQALKIETGEWRSLWPKYVTIAVLNYITSYHSSIGCDATECSMDAFSITSLIQKWVFVNKKSLSRLTSCPRFAWTDGNDFPRCPQKFHASLHQWQSVFW